MKFVTLISMVLFVAACSSSSPLPQEALQKACNYKDKVHQAVDAFDQACSVFAPDEE